MIKNVIFLLISFFLVSSCSSGQESKIEKLDYATLIEKGQSCAMNNKIDSAIIIFNKAIAVDKNRVEAYYGLGFSYSQNCFNTRTDCNKAIEYFNKVNEIAPSYRKVYYNLALCKGMLFDYKAAIDDMNKQISLDDTDPDYFHNRAGFKLLLNDTIGACEDYKRSFDLGNTYEQKWIDKICK